MKLILTYFAGLTEISPISLRSCPSETPAAGGEGRSGGGNGGKGSGGREKGGYEGKSLYESLLIFLRF